MKAKGIAGTLKGKFLLLYVGLILIPFLCLSVFVIFSAIHLIETNLYYSSQLAFQQTHQLVSYYMHHVNYAMNTLLSDEHLCEIIEQDNESKTLNQQVSDMLYIRDLLSSYRAKDEIEDVTLYVPFQAFYIGDASPIQNMGSIRDETWYLYAESCYPKQAIIPPQYFLDGNKISLAKFIRSSTNYTQSIGMVRFDIALSDLEKLLGKSGHTDDGYTYLVNSRKEYVAQNQKMDFFVPFDRLVEQADGSAHKISIDRRQYVVYAETIDDTDWYLVHVKPYAQIISSVMPQTALYFILFLVLVLSGLLFIYFFNHNFLDRLASLKNHLSEKNQALPDLIRERSKSDEIDDLIHSFNDLLKRVDRLMKEQYAMSTQIRELELKALYEQINPHFLYNTMSMINFMAEEGQIEKVSQVIEALSKFYKFTLSQGRATILLREEIQIIDAYVLIQKMRFGLDIQMIYDVKEPYMDLIIPKLTLQPLVENALVHGILVKRPRSGMIKMSVMEKGQTYVIIVEDDGVGMPENFLKQLNDGSLATKGSHYGIFNIAERLRLYYGESCSIHFESELGSGTKAILSIPQKNNHEDLLFLAEADG